MNNEKYRYKIDPEFRDLIPPLTQSEYEELEKSILSEGCRESIYTWNDYIIDGHNRYEICIKHGLEPPVFPMVFESREEVIIWICSVQLSRRNVTEPIRRYLIGKRYEAEKLVGAHNASGCNQYSRPEKEVRYQSDTEAPFYNDIVRTRDRLGKEYNLASATVYRYGEYAKTIDKIKEHSPNVAKDRKAGSMGYAETMVIMYNKNFKNGLIWNKLYSSKNQIPYDVMSYDKDNSSENESE